jgi:hypothetical protein
MALDFKERLTLSPLPLDERASVAMARRYVAGIAAAGGLAEAARVATNAVLARRADETPTEHLRLQRLYAKVYTRVELETLMLNTFAALGLED